MPRSGKATIDGILNIDKPYGITSMDVVRRVKRASGQRRVGHSGTLDPIATGVIPVCLGQATRLMEDVVGGAKSYLASIELGASTDTYDALGEVTERRDPSGVSLADIEGALPEFTGDILQVPPMYSALKRDGKRLYDLARAGVEVEREPRPVTVHGIALEGWEPPVVTLEVDCGKGFYMRSLAHDLGQALGCGGHMKTLARLRSGAFSVEDALPLEEAEERFADGSMARGDALAGRCAAGAARPHRGNAGGRDGAQRAFFRCRAATLAAPYRSRSPARDVAPTLRTGASWR